MSFLPRGRGLGREYKKGADPRDLREKIWKRRRASLCWEVEDGLSRKKGEESLFVGKKGRGKSGQLAKGDLPTQGDSKWVEMGSGYVEYVKNVWVGRGWEVRDGKPWSGKAVTVMGQQRKREGEFRRATLRCSSVGGGLAICLWK